jgi:hypothetical protein
MAWCFNVFFNVLLLGLFVSFHRATYRAKGKGARDKAE